MSRSRSPLITCLTRTVCCCESGRAFDFGRPGRYEAFGLTVISLLVSLFFWGVGVFGAVEGYGTPTVLSVCLESFIDLLSTGLVLYRLAEPDALLPTERNRVLERRTSVFCSLTMLALAEILIFHSIMKMQHGVVDGPRELTVEVLLAVPSSIAYLVVGMMQLQLAWALSLRSLKQDAMISILGAVVSLGTLFAALVNLISRIEDDEAATPPLPTPTALAVNDTAATALSAVAIGHSASALSSVAEVLAASGVRARALADAVVASAGPAAAVDRRSGLALGAPLTGRMAPKSLYRFWWLDEVCTILTATCMLVLGIWQLHEDTRSGVTWWTADFWCAELPPPSEDAGAGGPADRVVKSADGTRPAGEATPLVPDAKSASLLGPRAA